MQSLLLNGECLHIPGVHTLQGDRRYRLSLVTSEVVSMQQ